MPSVTQIIRTRARRRAAARRNIAGRLGLVSAVLFTLGLALALIAIPLAYSSLVRDLPSLAALPLLLEPPDGLLLHPTQILDRSGEHVLQNVQNPALEARRYLPVSESAAGGEIIAPVMVDATLAVLDPTFWSNPGFTLEGLTSGAAHTLAERLVSDLLLADEPPGLRRALRERILAGQMIRQFGRAKVLEWYLNSVYYGNLTYGVDAAAQVYFGKPASALTLPEAALLTAVGEAPALNPFDDPDAALQRQKIVLQAMAAQGYIPPEKAVAAAGQTLTFREPAPETPAPYQSFLNLVWEQLAREYDLERIERGGFRITTSLDYDLQTQADCTRRVLRARLQNPAEAKIPQDCPAARLLPTLPAGSQTPADLSAAVVILDPATGQILALLGDPNRGVDPAHLPGAAPGSMLTPILYLTAFTQGISPASLVWDVPTEIPGLPLPLVEEYHGPVRLRVAFANDYLIPALQTMNQVGAENVWRTAQELGLSSLTRAAEQTPPANCRGCALLFEGGETTLLALAHAYTPFANQGLLAGQPAGEAPPGSLAPLSPVAVLEIKDAGGKPLPRQADTERRPVITQQLAYLVTHVLSDEAARWPSLGHPNLLEIGRPAAAKLGGTADRTSAWTIGYTPGILIGVWSGAADAVSEGPPPPQVSAALWNALMQYATADLPPAAWEAPPGISVVEVCDPSGQLPTRYCPTVVSEVFLNGNEPVQFDSLYQPYQVNRETGLLATVFTPPELVETRVYMQLPPIAETWAQENNIPTPPESYDLIAMPPLNPDAYIAQPQMFADLRGEVEIRGTAAGEGFLSYRLQAGQGLNPQGWVQIGEDSAQPVRDGLLGVWDTSGLNGLFAIQMIVLREDNRVDTAVIQITVDNLPPEVAILYPQAEQTLPYAPGKKITFRAEASDNIGLKTVIFYLDGEALARQSQPPYAVPWYAKPGAHTLRVQAVDFAGNAREVQVTFQVEE